MMKLFLKNNKVPLSKNSFLNLFYEQQFPIEISAGFIIVTNKIFCEII